MGVWASGGALRNVYPNAAKQRCWSHKILNVLNKPPKREHAQAKPILCQVPYAETRNEAECLMSSFLTWCHKRGHQATAEARERDWERMVTFYGFPREYWLEDYEPGRVTLCLPEA